MSDTPQDKPQEEQLDDLGRDIDAARKHAEDAGILTDPDEPKFYESGEVGDELDDQQIAPPG